TSCCHLSPFFFHSPRPHPHLHSFPTRRSSDLTLAGAQRRAIRRRLRRAHPRISWPLRGRDRLEGDRGYSASFRDRCRSGVPRLRSEEHTSELQSRRDLVCRLLLEKKKKKKKLI